MYREKNPDQVEYASVADVGVLESHRKLSNIYKEIHYDRVMNMQKSACTKR